MRSQVALVELVLAAVAGRRRDGGRVAAGLALGDLLERRGRVARARTGSARGAASAESVAAVVGAVGREPERCERGRPDDAVDVEAVAALEAADGRLVLRP